MASLAREDRALGPAERRPADQAHEGEICELGVVADQRGSGGEPDRVPAGARGDPWRRGPDVAVRGPPLNSSEPGSGEDPADQRGVDGVDVAPDLPGEEADDRERERHGRPAPTREAPAVGDTGAAVTGVDVGHETPRAGSGA